MGFQRHLRLLCLVARHPHIAGVSTQSEQTLCKQSILRYATVTSDSPEPTTQATPPPTPTEHFQRIPQNQSKWRFGELVPRISLSQKKPSHSTAETTVLLESLSLDIVGSNTFPCSSDATSPQSLPSNIFYSATASDDSTNSHSSATASVCPALTSPQGILVPTLPQSMKQSLQVAAGLSKARLSLLVVSTAVVGCALAASTNLTSPLFVAHPYRTLLCLALGTGLTSAAANTVNQIVEIPYDSQMMRTQNRVLVRGLTYPGRAGMFALGCASTGLLTLYCGVNPLVMGLAAGNMLLYTTLYTPLKQFSQANTWIGALVGGVPPLMGWAAATGEIHSGSLILASLLYVWQFPHFMALSWNLRGEYSKAGYMMTSVLEPTVCKQVALRYAVACSLVCLAGAGCSAISLGPWAGCALGLTCLPPNIGLIYYAWQFSRADSPDGSSAAARRLFRSTLLHLPVVMTAAIIATYICGTAVGIGS